MFVGLLDRVAGGDAGLGLRLTEGAHGGFC